MALKVRISNFFFDIAEWLKTKITGKEVEYHIGPNVVWLENKGETDETEPGNERIS